MTTPWCNLDCINFSGTKAILFTKDSSILLCLAVHLSNLSGITISRPIIEAQEDSGRGAFIVLEVCFLPVS